MPQRKARIILITGGAGFIGSNLVERLLLTASSARIRILDNLSRSGVSHNLAWLRTLPGSERLEFIKGDVRDRELVRCAGADATEIFHLAAQVAVTTSIQNPREDFEVNVSGTFNVLEAARLSGRCPFLLFTSTNKVYGSLDGVPVTREGTRYVAQEPTFDGVTESEQVDFHSPYGCSKGAADQYVRDYARIYDLPTVVFRMSCIAGPRQFGTEDQGWVAHFLYSALERCPITIYGDGLQVRDVLHVYDLIDAMDAARNASERTKGEIYNVGGGMERAISVTEMLKAIAEETGTHPILRSAGVRPGDQPLYISNTSKIHADTGWDVQHSCKQTLQSIHKFWDCNRKLLTRQRHEVARRGLMTEEVA
ncbi:MAG: GDP-mannose 4,6-dehydratase [Acidobacteriota bacterium]|nr:GDP-mannose 4,6-dehydratase [Acidobacteriota bacterium]